MKLILKRSTLKNKRAETDVRDNTKNETPFQPEYDAAGNQTLIKTSTGIWSVSYNVDKRPTSFSQAQGDHNTIIECGYDYMGRRYMKKVISNGTVTLHQRYIYRVYLQIACVDLSRSGHPALWYITWDPTEPVATRPLAIQKNATWYSYSHDLTKNVTELYKTDGLIATSYDYSPYGVATAEGTDQPLQWSSEYHDPELALTYYNYRHYNPTDGRWINRDPIQEQVGLNLYQYAMGTPIKYFDRLGLDVTIRNTIAAMGFHWQICVTAWEKSGACKTNKQNTQDLCCHQGQQYKKINKEYCIGFGPKNMSQMFPHSNPLSKEGSRYPTETNHPTLMPPQMSNVNGSDANGIVSSNEDNADKCTGEQPKHLPPVKTSCAEDIKIKQYMEGQVGQTANYNLIGNKNNCRWYSFYVYSNVITNIINPSRQQ